MGIYSMSWSDGLQSYQVLGDRPSVLAVYKSMVSANNELMDRGFNPLYRPIRVFHTSTGVECDPETWLPPNGTGEQA